MVKINLCGIRLENFINIDVSWSADKRVDLEKKRIPMKDGSVDVLICMSAINYFTLDRAQFLIKDVYRVLKPKGWCRFGTQDLELIADKYLQGDSDFTCHRINRWFGNGDGYKASGKICKYVYDYDTLSKLFVLAGFGVIWQVQYQMDRSPHSLGQYDNREQEMLYLEAVK